MTPPITPPAAPMSAADDLAHEKASHRRPAQISQETVTLPADPAARRRLIAQRKL
ncbi:hypothetical protein ABZ154_15410 [Streptomyces sp. NPDC006261]|uniref:hypothetical protein n=1 Tax=Streptomyces sp. NPDC006261 TaxID=3156739 RepID=UPI0033AC04D9